MMDKFRSRQQKYLITAADLDSLIEVLKKMKNGLALLSIDKLSKTVVVSSTANFVNDHVLPLKEIIFVDIREIHILKSTSSGMTEVFMVSMQWIIPFPTLTGKML
jgi:hypothetical protein